ncbi:MAG: luciferase family protein [Pseudonocardiales bacterium]|nr:luciferase family protein [Pseudonocardiales bacterium]
MSTLATVPLSILDVAPVGEGSTPAEAVQATVALARRADELGFTRFWVAEHHGMPGIASSAPAVLIGAVAAATERIRVGSGGVMLPNHAPLVVAEQFGTLAALYPGRIDLGLGRAPGTDQRTAAALRRSAAPLGPDDFPQQLGELACFLTGEFPDGHPYRSVHAVPEPAEAPPIWLLGSSLYSAELAGILGLPFAFAHHFSGTNTLPALDTYRGAFRPSASLDEPHAMVTVQVVCAADDAEADRIALPAALSFLRLRQGRPGRLPTPEQAEAYPWRADEREFAAQRRDGQAIGSPETVRASLAALIDATAADELMITTIVHSPADRLRSTELVRGLFTDASYATMT